MKYNLFINQFAAVRMAVKVDIVDLAIFDIVEALMNSKAAVSILKEGTIWYRIPARLIIEQGPLLGIRTERGIAKRLDSLIAAGLLERNSDNNRMQGCFIRLGKRYDEYKFYRNETTQGGTDVPGGWNESSSNNNIINNNIPTREDITTEESITNVISSSSVIPSLSGSAREEDLRRRKFTPPTVEQVRDYCDGRGPEYQSIDPEEFVAFYQSKGWMVGKAPMKDWRAALTTWARKRVRGGGRPQEPVKAPVEIALEENAKTLRRLAERSSKGRMAIEGQESMSVEDGALVLRGGAANE